MVSRRMLHDGAEIGAKGSPIPARAGIGLRFPHHQAVLDAHPAIGWFEIHAENYFAGGSPLTYLEHVRRDYPLSCHGVGLSLGSAGGIDHNHLRRLRDLVTRFEPGLVSEHLSWSVVGGRYLADLLPLPLTGEALDVVCRNIDAVQNVSRAPHPGRKPVLLSAVSAFDDPGMGFPRRGRAEHRLRPVVRCQ